MWCYPAFLSVSAIFYRREFTIFNRVAVIILLGTSLYVICIDTGIYNSLFHQTVPALLSVTPIVVYTNADLEKQAIMKENRGKSGVYRWTNLVSGKTYVGSSVNLSQRLRDYYGAAYLNRDHCMFIYRALLKHGHSNFKLEFLNIANPRM
jgi:hypothetical protein